MPVSVVRVASQALISRIHMGSHNHTISGYSHRHTFLGNVALRTRASAFAPGRRFSEFEDNGIPISKGSPTENVIQALYAPGISDPEQAINMEFDFHNHEGFTGTQGATETGVQTAANNTSAVGLTTESALGSINTEPPWEGFVYIMRV